MRLKVYVLIGNLCFQFSQKGISCFKRKKKRIKQNTNVNKQFPKIIGRVGLHAEMLMVILNLDVTTQFSKGTYCTQMLPHIKMKVSISHFFVLFFKTFFKLSCLQHARPDGWMIFTILLFCSTKGDKITKSQKLYFCFSNKKLWNLKNRQQCIQPSHTDKNTLQKFKNLNLVCFTLSSCWETCQQFLTIFKQKGNTNGL